VRDTLFGDVPVEKWLPKNADESARPWSEFVAAHTRLTAGDQPGAVAAWRSIVEQPGLEPRHYLQAWHFLRARGVQPPTDRAKSVLGVVVEVSLKEGLDLLAAYADYSARYYNHSGAGVVWEHPDTSLDSTIDTLLAAAGTIVAQIGPWKGERPGPPSTGQARLSFLTPSGLHFGQGDMGVLASDPLAGGLLRTATLLMQGLIAKRGAA
jgi:hypothetical protein